MDRKRMLGPLALGAAVLIALPLLGCASADVIGSAAGGVTVKFVPTGGSGRYATASWSVGTVIFQPSNPTAQAALGGQVLSLSGSAIPVDLTGATASTSVTVTLAEGGYEITSLVLRNLTLSGWSDQPPPVTCYDLVQVPPVQPAEAQISNPAPALTFAVAAKGSHVVEVRIDVPALIDAYLTSYDCNGGSLSNYDATHFAQSLYPGVLSLSQTQ